MQSARDLSDISFQRLDRRRLREAAAMAARAMAADPMSIEVFADGSKRLRGLETVFTLTLRALKLPALLAIRNGQIVGIVAYARAGECFFKQMARRRVVRLGGLTITLGAPSVPFRLLPTLLSMGSSTMSRLSKWTEVTTRHDPGEAHQHIELVAVAPAFQGQGIGRRMMEHVLDEMRSYQGMPYLETNTEVDIRFYERFGFEILDTSNVHGVTISFMGIRNWPPDAPDAGVEPSRNP